LKLGIVEEHADNSCVVNRLEIGETILTKFERKVGCNEAGTRKGKGQRSVVGVV
jgi:hypothetical protein